MRTKQPLEEGTYLADELVTVTKTRAIISGITYAMANITSVSTFVEPRPVMILVIAAAVFVVGLLFLGQNLAAALICGAGSLAFLAFYWFYYKPKYWVRLGTAGAESNAVWSQDPAYTQSVVDAISKALDDRG